MNPLWAILGGIAALALFMGLMWLFDKVNRLTWPIWLFLIITAVLYLLSWASEDTPGKIARSILGPAICGLTILFGLLIVFNLTYASKMTIRKTENLIVWANTHLPSWTKLAWLPSMLLLLLLMSICYFLPRLKLLSAYSSLKKRIQFGTSALTTLASFSFFTNTAVIQPKISILYSSLAVRYIGADSIRTDAAAQYLALHSISSAIQRLNGPTVAYDVKILRKLNEICQQPDAQKAVGTYLGNKWSEQSNSIPVLLDKIFTGLRNSDVEDQLMASKTPLEDVVRMEATVGGAVEKAKQLKKGVTQLFSETLDVAKGSLQEAIIDGAITRLTPFFKSLARNFLSNAVDKQWELWTGPAMDEAADQLFTTLRFETTRPGAKAVTAEQKAQDMVSAFVDEKSDDCVRQAIQIFNLAEKAQNTRSYDPEKAATLIEDCNQKRIALETDIGVVNSLLLQIPPPTTTKGEQGQNLSRILEMATKTDLNDPGRILEMIDQLQTGIDDAQKIDRTSDLIRRATIVRRTLLATGATVEVTSITKNTVSAIQVARETKSFKEIFEVIK